MPGPDRAPDKASALRRHHALNARPDEVADPAFNGDNSFFDAQDLVQVKYEMLRRVREEGQAVSQASATFGFSRPSFYEAQAAFSESGLPGLVPQRPGPSGRTSSQSRSWTCSKRPGAAQPSLNSAALARIVAERLRSPRPPPRRRAGIAETGKRGAGPSSHDHHRRCRPTWPRAARSLAGPRLRAQSRASTPGAGPCSRVRAWPPG